MFNRSSKRKCEVKTYSNEIQLYREKSLKLFAGYLWLNRPLKRQKWKRVYTCLYSSQSLYSSGSMTYLVWWANKHESEIRGFILLNDFDVVHYLANSICIKPNGLIGVQIILKADNTKDTADWITHLRHFSTRHNKTTEYPGHTKRSSLTDEEESCCEESSRMYSSSSSIQCNTPNQSAPLNTSELDRVKHLIEWTYLYNGILSDQ